MSCPVVELGAFSFSQQDQGPPGLLRARECPRVLSLSAEPFGACTFSARKSKQAFTLLASKKATRASRARALPFASLSLAQGLTPLPFASMTKALPAQEQEGKKKKKSIAEILEHARKRALAGGIPGMVAMALQVVTLMWLRTTINYQYRHGTSTMMALRTLYKDGGIPRFYQGMLPALIQGPLSRFGDTAANTGTLALLEDADMPPAFKTIAASLAAGCFRIFLMPVDALKTIMQVEGKQGIPSLLSKVKNGGPTVLYHGALAASAATFVGHYPWFAVYNTLNDMLPAYDELSKRLLRSAFIGFCSSFVSDCCSNSIRVIKTSKQASTVPITYTEVVKQVLEKEGVAGLMGRGLGTKLISNGMQGILFSVLWRLGQDYYAKKEKEKAAAEAADSKASKK
uniref:Mitochondrial carrier protein n=1 Tax=Dunaliella tertiolecta TaxID=3047 RepID=A0A7S3VMZ8_DUNTE|mmetsp:Transcript_13000/g.35416  ORF Transcript_13000/g.35416 Transcript_13000/m.35416 type:complete len:400 (-) Transcript_13000:608-1807(-)|eukprot:CAMPEP_0202346802 /NCGR_PEP_ID=MMETSP1126-20121109/5433_1 /ASSEMBLY_ACC=CAM_ASM_000457 /TAXON_ID=3047 /ORGANISM="Dunaliella tertiolecta, Strain CCMP1320" /LENGTH=399 /DNA_ID=CAMNT_0048938255 /DNA_START=117 /DNA_END=1316 /DNA_ORIENTATION=-